MPAGRPTKYNKEMQEKAWHYVNNYKDYGDVVPTHEALQIELGIVSSTMYKWGREYPEFSRTLEQCNRAQARESINGSMNGVYNATIAKLLLVNQGYTDKQDVNLGGQNGANPIQGEIKFSVVDSKKQD
jgi:hypothetical protein